MDSENTVMQENTYSENEPQNKSCSIIGNPSYNNYCNGNLSSPFTSSSCSTSCGTYVNGIGNMCCESSCCDNLSSNSSTNTTSMSQNISNSESQNISNSESQNISNSESGNISNSESGNINILKSNTILTQNQYNKEQINREYNELYMKSKEATQEEEKKKESERIYNLSIKQIINNASKVYIDIINEITISIDNKEFNIEQVIKIFTLKDRLIYVGILIVVLSLFLGFIFISD